MYIILCHPYGLTVFLYLVDVRFIEYMPFDGNKWNDKKLLPYKEMIKIIQSTFPDFKRCNDEDGDNDTSKAWRVPGFRGKASS